MASQTVSEILTQKGHSVTLKEAVEAKPEDVVSAQLVIFASPSWDYADKEGMPHEHFFPLMSGLEGKPLENKPFALLGLGDKSYAHFCGGVDHFEQFVTKVKGKLAVPSLRVDGYFFDQAGNTQKITDWANQLASIPA